MTKVALADVLWDAANTRLWDGVEDFYRAADVVPLDSPGVRHHAYSCDAVAAEVLCAIPSIPYGSSIVRTFLCGCGCQVYSTGAFSDEPEGERRQGVRYMWLLLAMHVAEDEGIEIEVAS